MKWKNHKIIILQGGLFGNHTETCRAINRNAEVLKEACNHIKHLEEKIEELEQLKEQNK